MSIASNNQSLQQIKWACNNYYYWLRCGKKYTHEIMPEINSSQIADFAKVSSPHTHSVHNSNKGGEEDKSRVYQIRSQSSWSEAQIGYSWNHSLAHYSKTFIRFSTQIIATFIAKVLPFPLTHSRAHSGANDVPTTRNGEEKPGKLSGSKKPIRAVCCASKRQSS